MHPPQPEDHPMTPFSDPSHQAFIARADRVIANARADTNYELARLADRIYSVPEMYLAIRELRRRARKKFIGRFVDVALSDVIDSVKADPDHSASLTAEELADPLLICPAGRLVLDGNHRAYQRFVSGHTHASAFRLHTPLASFEVRADLRAALSRWEMVERLCGYT
jgi:hypothetical protein